MDCSEKGLEQVLPLLVEAQHGLSNITAREENPHTGSKYVTLAEWVDAIRTECKRVGLGVVQHSTLDQKDLGDGNNILGVTVQTYLLSKSEYLSFGGKFVPLSEKADKSNRPQKMAGAVTYARRYALTELFFVASTNEDTDGADHSQDEAVEIRRVEDAQKKAPEAWEGSLAKIDHKSRMELIDGLIEICREKPELEGIVQQFEASARPTEKNSFGAARSLIRAVSRATGTTPEILISEVIE
jgi:hypothetical protein